MNQATLAAIAVAGGAMICLALLGVALVIALRNRAEPVVAANHPAPNAAASLAWPGPTAVAPPAAPSAPKPTPNPASSSMFSQPATAGIIPVATSSGAPPGPPTTAFAPVAPAAPPAGSVSVASLSPINSKPRVAYDWEPGKSYNYRFSVRRGSMGELETNGTVSYGVNMAPGALANLVAEQTDEQCQGSGTGFVVHSDGLLVTCAHVVDGATKVEVTLGSQTYNGQIVAVDDGHDLALVRIPATGLPALHLADSNALQLAEEVRAVGFPLSDVLGTSVKITRGSIAGFREQGSGRMLQVDANINPGNSGGPLVNGRGEVVGVVSSGLFGESIQEVGFGVPSNDARNLLASKGVSNSAGPNAAQLDGPAVARLVTPAVAFIKITSGGEDGSKQALMFDGRWESPTGPRQDVRGALVATSAGRVLAEEGEDRVPLPNSTLARLVFEHLPLENKDSWEVRRVSEMVVPLGSSVESPGFGPFGRRRLYESFQPQQLAVIPIVEESKYRILQETAAGLEISKTYSVTTALSEGEESLFSLTGQGTLIFDQQQQVPKSMKATFKFEVQKNGVPEVIVHSAVDYDLLNVIDGIVKSAELPRRTGPRPLPLPASVAAATPNVGTPDLAPAPQVTPQPAQPPPVPRDEQPLDVNRLRQIINLMKSGDTSFGTLYSPLAELSRMRADPQYREEVAAALDPLLTTKNSSVRNQAMRAVRVWGTQTNVPTLLKLMEELDSGIRHDAMDGLGHIGGSQEAAEKIAQLLGDDEDRTYAGRSLKKMGEIAENTTLKMLDHPNRQTRDEACRVLAEVGGKKSITALQKLMSREPNGFDASAKIAIDDIQKRLGEKP